MTDSPPATPEEKTTDSNSPNPPDNPAGSELTADSSAVPAQTAETSTANESATPDATKAGSENGPASGGADQEDNSLESAADSTSVEEEAPTPVKQSGLKRLSKRINIYLIILIATVLMAMIIILIAYVQSHSSPKNSTVPNQKLTQSTLQQLANSDTTVGNSQYVLNVESNAIFAGQVIIKQSLEVAGNLQVGGTAAFNNISVAGTGQFSQATINNNLTVGGNSAVQGSATIAKSLQVSSGGSFGGAVSAPQITTSNLELDGNLVLQHHISVSGSIPSQTNGTAALGNGGSVSIGGTDTAGSITINTGSSPSFGCFVTITFSTPFNTIPHVIVSPVGYAAGGLAYYVIRSTTSFSVCDTTPPPATSSFGFDYFIVD